MADKILVADDNANLLELVQRHLERAGYQAITANDGREAMRLIYSARLCPFEHF